MLDAAMYNLLMETQAALFAAGAAGMQAGGVANEPPPALLQVSAGRAESPGWFLIQTAEFDPEPLTVANLRVRDVYAAPRMVQALLDLMASTLWLEHDGRDAYSLGEPGREILRRIHQRRRRLLTYIPPLPESALDGLEALLGRIIHASLDSPFLPGTWCLAHSRRRAPAEDAPPLSRIMHYFDDFNAFRDDAHMAAWRPYAVEGYIWEAFAFVVRGEAQTADALLNTLAYRGNRRREYAHALTVLAHNGWIEIDTSGLAESTAEGRAVHEAAERDTDRFFYAPWGCLREHEIAQLQSLLVLVHDFLDAVQQM